MSDKSPLIACISLCLIDDKFHEDEKRYLEDICEEEWELSVDEVQNVHDEIKDKGINCFYLNARISPKSFNKWKYERGGGFMVEIKLRG